MNPIKFFIKLTPIIILAAIIFGLQAFIWWLEEKLEPIEKFMWEKRDKLPDWYIDYVSNTNSTESK